MLKATDYEILRKVRANARMQIPLARKPLFVATLLDEAAFTAAGGALDHLNTVFCEERVHDWYWKDGMFMYYTRVMEVADVVLVYAMEKIEGAQAAGPELAAV